MQKVTPPTPRLLGLEAAAAYVGLSPRGFEGQWRAGKMPAPHRIGRRLLWDRRLLDQFVDVLSGFEKPPELPVKRKWTR